MYLVSMSREYNVKSTAGKVMSLTIVKIMQKVSPRSPVINSWIEIGNGDKKHLAQGYTGSLVSNSQSLDHQSGALLTEPTRSPRI